jgi:hypothetical protein
MSLIEKSNTKINIKEFKKIDFNKSVIELEKIMITYAYIVCDGNISEMGRYLLIGRDKVKFKMNIPDVKEMIDKVNKENINANDYIDSVLGTVCNTSNSE